MGGFVRQAIRLGPFALLIVAGCKTNGPRGHAFTPDRTYAPQAQDRWPQEVQRTPARLGPHEGHGVITSIAALLQAMVESEHRDAQIVQAGAPTKELRAFAAETIERTSEHLDALRTLVTAEQLPVEAPAVQADPLIAAEHDVARRNTTTLQALSGKVLAAAYLSAAPQRLGMLASLAELGVRASPDVAAGNVFRLVARDARALAHRAVVAADGLGEP